MRQAQAALKASKHHSKGRAGVWVNFGNTHVKRKVAWAHFCAPAKPWATCVVTNWADINHLRRPANAFGGWCIGTTLYGPRLRPKRPPPQKRFAGATALQNSVRNGSSELVLRRGLPVWAAPRGVAARHSRTAEHSSMGGELTGSPWQSMYLSTFTFPCAAASRAIWHENQNQGL